MLVERPTTNYRPNLPTHYETTIPCPTAATTMLGNDLIASYEVDFKLLKTIIDRKLDDARDLYGEPRKAVMREIERAIDDADEIVG